MKSNSGKNLILDPRGVDSVSEELRGFLSELKMTSRDAARYILTVEEILLNHIDAGDQGSEVRLITGVRFRQPYIRLEVEGGRGNRYITGDEELQSIYGNSYLASLGISPKYNYTENTNVYSFRLRRIRKGTGTVAKILIALAAGAAFGFAGMAFPDGVRNQIMNCAISPVYDAFMNVLGAVAGPMIFLSVVWGIYGLGDAAALKKIGKKIIAAFLGVETAVTVLCGIVLLPLFDLKTSGEAGSISGMSELVTMVTDFIPSDIISPFAEGNTLQIIFMAVIFGTVLLYFGENVGTVISFTEQANTIIQAVMETVGKLIPIFLFAVIVNTFWSGKAAEMSSLWKLLMLYLAATAAAMAATVICVSVRCRVSAVTLVKKIIPLFITAVTTASSAASLGTNVEICRNGYGMNDSVTSFGVPLGIVAFKPGTVLEYMIMTLFFAEMYGVDFSIQWLVTAMFSVVVISVATPPVVGGAVTALMVLFVQVGIPAEAVASALACDAVIDFVATGCSQFMMPMVMIGPAEKSGLLDRKVLLSKE